MAQAQPVTPPKVPQPKALSQPVVSGPDVGPQQAIIGDETVGPIYASLIREFSTLPPPAQGGDSS